MLIKAYSKVKIGDPSEKGVLCGPLHSKTSVKIFEEAVKAAKEQVRKPIK
jgi:aldehyde dehydrogenase family 7 member A1